METPRSRSAMSPRPPSAFTGAMSLRQSAASDTQSYRSVPTSKRNSRGQFALSGALDSLSHLSLTDIIKLREILNRADTDSLADAYFATLTSKLDSQRQSTASSFKNRAVEDHSAQRSPELGSRHLRSTSLQISGINEDTFPKAEQKHKLRRRSKSIATFQKPTPTSKIPVLSKEPLKKYSTLTYPSEMYTSHSEPGDDIEETVVSTTYLAPMEEIMEHQEPPTPRQHIFEQAQPIELEGSWPKPPEPVVNVSPALSQSSSLSSTESAAKSLTSGKSQRSSVSSFDEELNELLGELHDSPITPVAPTRRAPWAQNDDPMPTLKHPSCAPGPLELPPTIPGARVSRAETDILSLLDYSTVATAEEKRSEFWTRLQRDLMKTPVETGPSKHRCPETNCNQDFARTRELTKHLEDEHSQLIKFTCRHTEPGQRICEFATFDKMKWNDHHKSIHRCTLDSITCCIPKPLPRRLWACGLCSRQRFTTVTEWSRHYVKHLKQEGKTIANVSFSMKMFNLLSQEATVSRWSRQSEKTLKDGKFWIGWNEKSANAQDLMHVLECGVFEGKELSEPDVASKVVKLAITLGRHPTAANIRASKYPTRTTYLNPFPRHLAHVAQDSSRTLP